MGSKIHAGRIEHPSAWTNERIGGKAGLLLAIRPEHQDAVFDLLEKTRDIPTTEVRRADFRHPAVDALMKDVHDILMHGRGVVIVTGLDISGMPVEDVERIYWGLGTHLGSGCVQSPALDRIGHVRKADSPTPRGYLSSLELKPHTDAHEAMSLMSVRKSASGGESGLVSALAIHNAIQETRPELLAPLYEGYWYAMHETRQDQSPMSDSKIPVFCNVDGKVSCLINPFFMHVAARMRGETLPADLAEAIAYFYELAERPDLRARFMLEPGEMMFWHNYMNLHSRTEFHDTPEHTRLLLRLWFNMPTPRPHAPEFKTRIYNRFDEYDRPIEPELLDA